MEVTQSTSSITERIAQIREQLPERVRLIAVTKQVSVEAMREAYAAGIRDFGESRLQEALPKQEQLQNLPDICWHFIGHLQSNKAQKTLETFQWIHACDRLKLAQRLNRLAGELAVRPQVCLQVKVLSDPNKYGWEVAQLQTDLPQLNQCQNIAIQGLMTILPLGLSETEALAAFQATRDLSSQIGQENYPNLALEEFSMGMSGDYLLAVRAGATMVRLGRIIFGERPPVEQ
ncbi:MAG: YggS family pyridoxal phosphate-dependent enzyme [Cyanobacteriota bacterium]|nr:YggS family pyridoxal phosphate-dependent enzyme [Cyanobacteriota bacterium]